MPGLEAAACLLWWRSKAATFVLAMNRVDEVDLVDAELVDVDLVDVDLVDGDLERAIDQSEIKTRAPDIRLRR